MSRSRLAKSIALIFVSAVIGVSIYLWRQNTELRNRLAVSERPKAPAVRRVREGDNLPEFTARDTNGREVKVAARGAGNTLLFIFSPTCDRCEAGMPAWFKVNDKLAQLQARVQIIALSIADSYTTVAHARQTKSPFATVPFPDVELQKKYGATEVPLTVVVDPQGVVQAVWDKPLDEGEVGDVIETVCPECLKQAVFNH